MIIVGLTGSVGMGKTTTTRLFEEAGASTWSADAAVHRLYEAGAPGALAIAKIEPRALTADGAVDRDRLRELTQASSTLLTRIEAAIHPLVKVDREQFVAAARTAGAELVVLEIPLLFETEGEGMMDVVVVASASETIQRERVLARDGMNSDAFEWIKSRQVSDHDKRERADYVVTTDRGIEDARTQVRQILQELATTQPKRRTKPCDEK